ncbi:MAG: acyclic terpene utilization AtuA family protein, partial [Pseudomonadota bacterium]
RGTVAEQMLYEIGDPVEYVLPDVVCDFTQVHIEEDGPDRIRVSGARGRGRTGSYKASLTLSDGHRIAVLFFMIGAAATQKAQAFFEATLSRTRAKLRALDMEDFTAVALERVGDDTHFGGGRDAREIAFRISVRHSQERACTLLLKEASGLGLATPPGLVIYGGARPKPQPVVRLFSTLVDKSVLDIAVDGAPFIPPGAVQVRGADVPLERLAWLRSGDKGDIANIGVAARRAAYLPYIWAALTEETVAERFAHVLDGPVERFHLPGSHAVNFVLHRALGGGGTASLRLDPQGKSFGQVLAGMPIPVPGSLL